MMPNGKNPVKSKATTNKIRTNDASIPKYSDKPPKTPDNFLF